VKKNIMQMKNKYREKRMKKENRHGEEKTQ
jgi:hypothetical protein